MKGRLKAAAGFLALLAVLSILGGCANRTVRAPVSERATARPAPAPKPPVAQATPTPGAPAASTADGYYQVKRGDTLYAIALEHGVDYRELSQWNSLDDPSKLRVGQLLRVKAPEQRQAAVEVAPARTAPGRLESRPLDASPAAPAPEQKVARADPKPAPAPAPASAQSAAPAASSPKVEEAVDFVWPVKGKVISGFSEPRSKGIDIDGKLGDPVVAAASGRVTYIGSGIPGLGKLVVIKHDNGFITVYAHNKDILVKEQQAVTRGQKIAELGATDSDRPKLHFQIRKGASPVDPLRYLPGS